MMLGKLYYFFCCVKATNGMPSCHFVEKKITESKRVQNRVLIYIYIVSDRQRQIYEEHIYIYIYISRERERDVPVQSNMVCNVC